MRVIGRHTCPAVRRSASMYEDLGVVPPAGPGTESSYFRGFRAQALQLKIFETFSGKICGRPRAVAECDHKLI